MGKTSVSEAVEWVLTGHLSRRESGEHGHPTELANCIANEFRPEGAETSVELGLTINGTRKILRRVLRKDYSRIASDAPISDLFIDDKKLSVAEEVGLLNELFAGVHPILMQHNLRRFVHDEPDDRRQYFERLLQIDELTALIEKAVVGPGRLRQISNPGGGTGLTSLRALAEATQELPNGQAIAGRLTKLERVAPRDLSAQLEKELLVVARTYFGSESRASDTLLQLKERLAEAHRIQREARLPVLAPLTAARSQPLPPWAPLQSAINEFGEATEGVTRLRAAASALTRAQEEVAKAATRLAAKGLLDPKAIGDQICPLCEDARQTLTQRRVADLNSWAPLATQMSDAERAVAGKRRAADSQVTQFCRSLDSAIPVISSPEATKQLKRAPQHLATVAGAAISSANLLSTSWASVRAQLSKLAELIRNDETRPDAIQEASLSAATSVARLLAAVPAHREQVANLEEAVGSASQDDVVYRARDRWLDLAGLTGAVAKDVEWESAKQAAKASLDGLRDGLIALRSQIIENARATFSANMTQVWQLLRNDSGAHFSRILVPEPRGKGYKLEFELKAVISDGSSETEVDALRVFSESQVNVIGIAAYVTRARALGHRVLLFDDPVQSMDEEHFRTFASKLLPELLDSGFQVIVMTHSDTFARRLNEAHYLRPSYATLEARASKRKGCQIDEGNRRVAERLKNAARRADEGELQEAWRFVRLALERLYVLAYMRAMPDFDPEKWAGMAAEDMWNQGAGKVIREAAPDSGPELKRILGMTVAGAHDKAATSETDLKDAVKYITALLQPLRVGAG